MFAVASTKLLIIANVKVSNTTILTKLDDLSFIIYVNYS